MEQQKFLIRDLPLEVTMQK